MIVPSLRPPSTPCSAPCAPEGCDGGCDRHVTWKPIPGVPFVKGMSPNGVIFAPASHDGGGRLFSPVRTKSGVVKGKRVGSVKPVKGPTFAGR